MKILVFGDSIAYGKWDSQGGWVTRLRKYIDEKFNPESNYQVYNLSIPGEVTIHLSERLIAESYARVLPDQKDYLIIFAVGINDANPANWLTSQATPTIKFKEIIKNLYQAVKKSNIKVAFIGLTPINDQGWLANSKFTGKFFLKHVREYDSYLAEICKELKIPYLPLLDELLTENFQTMLVDGIHPNDRGHEILFEKILKFLQKENLIEK